jgi:hypothetical protein
MNEFKSEHKAEKYFKKDKNMEPMDNPEFDRYFPCQRDNEVQFRTLFSPLAQEEIIKLMKVKSDYLFTKHKTINIITSPSFENINFNVNYNNYQQEFDYSKIQAHFIEDNKLFFKDIYFMFAPILAIPLYQQYPYHQPIFEKTKQKLLAYSQNESIVNTMHNIDNFKHPQSVTDNILKTKRIFANDLCEINEIIAHGYRSSSRIVIVTVTDVEAGVVSVPVTVIDYFAVQKSTNVINSFVDHSAKDFDTNNSSFRSV